MTASPADRLHAAATLLRNPARHNLQPSLGVVLAKLLDSVAERHVWVDGPTGGDDYWVACRTCWHEPGTGEEDDDPCPDKAAVLAVADAILGAGSAAVTR